MSDYEYTDRDKDKLIVMNAARYKSDILYVGVIRRDQEFGVDVRNEDAPAIALAILEAAGYNDDSEMFAASAVRNLRRVEEIRAEKAERESEDAKALEFRKVISPGIRPGASITPKDRDLYTAARKFFEGS